MSHYIGKNHVIHTFSPKHPPVSRVKAGELLVFETYDCYMGQLLEEGSDFRQVDRSLSNPATGPVFIEGACPGDILRVEVRAIDLDPVGILDKGPSGGALKKHFPEYIICRLPVSHGMVHYRDLEIPVRPMIGVIGTAPASGQVSTLSPGDYGGNMDCTSIGPGTVLYLPVNVEGGLLAMGDLHAVMGDGECGNCGVEIGGRVTVRAEVVKECPVKGPLCETDTWWVSIASAGTLDDACEMAVEQMFSFLTLQAGLSAPDAGMLMDMLGNLAVCQIVNPLKTVRMEMPKWPLQKRGFYGLRSGPAKEDAL